jgi:hypothetical protein
MSDEHFVNAVVEGGAPTKAIVTSQRDSKNSDGETEQVVDLWVFPTDESRGAGRVLTAVPLLDKPGDNGEPPKGLDGRANYAYAWSAGQQATTGTGTAKTVKR